MDQQEKHCVTAYFFWLVVGLFAGHRFYLARTASALLFILAHAGAWAFLFYAQHTDTQQYAWPALLMLAGVYAWLVVDLVFIPSMTDRYNDQLDAHQGPYSPGPISMDAGFQATLKKAGVTPDGPRKKSAIPEDYVLPWRRADDAGPERT